MADSSDELERMNREQLVLKARVLGVERAELMTRVELRDEIVRRSEPDLAQQKRARGFLGVARDLVASVVEAGLNLPDAAAIIRGDGARESDWKGPPPVATVTLAEIYAAQGHLERALRMLDEVLAKEPDHDPARALRDRLAAGTDIPVAAPRRRQRISFGESANDLAATQDPPPANVPDLPPEPPEEIAAAARQPEPAAPDPINVPEPELNLPPEAPQEIAAATPEAEPQPEPEPEAAAPDPVNVPEPEAEPAAAAPDPVNVPEREPAAAPDPVNVPEPEAEPAAAAPDPVNVPEPEAEPVPDLPAEPAPSEKIAALPLSLFTLSLAGQRQIYWEVPATTWSALRARSPQGRALLRVISFRTRAGKVERQTQDLMPRTEVGSVTLPGLRADAVVRAVLGWEVDGRFLPFVIASDLGGTSSKRGGSFHAHPLVGAVAPGAPERAQSHFARR